MYDRIRREVSYIEGLLEGNNRDEKALIRLVGVIDELVEATQKLDTRQAELEEYAEAIDEDLNDLELLFYDDKDGETLLTCPECGEDVAVDLDDLDNNEIELLCPNCRTTLTIEDASEEEEIEKLEV